ncbi:hypothetical protein R615_14450 [Thalassolituus oleivorans R6-15]|nr:hypothetical protein R615_14450 [Thalassolituus oleivorans R6-15]
MQIIYKQNFNRSSEKQQEKSRLNRRLQIADKVLAITGGDFL